MAQKLFFACCLAGGLFCWPPAALSSSAGGGACRRALMVEAAGLQFHEGILRLYESQQKKAKKKKRGQGLFESLIETQIAEGKSRAEILRRAAEARHIAPDSKTSSLFNIILNQPPEAAAAMISASPRLLKAAALNPLPLFAAALMGERQIAEAFLDARPELIQAENSAGERLLSYAADPEMAAFLLARGADPNIQDKKGLAPLHHARSGGIAKALLEHGASTDLKDRSGQPIIKYHENLLQGPAPQLKSQAEGESQLSPETLSAHQEVLRLLYAAKEGSQQKREPRRAKSPPAPPDPEKLALMAAAEKANREKAAAEAAERAEEALARTERKRAQAAKRQAEREAAAAERQKQAEERQALQILQKEAALACLTRWQSFDAQKYQALAGPLGAGKKMSIKILRKFLKKLGPAGDRQKSMTQADKAAEDSIPQAPPISSEALLSAWMESRPEEELREMLESTAQKINQTKKKAESQEIFGHIEALAQKSVDSVLAARLVMQNRYVHSFGGNALKKITEEPYLAIEDFKNLESEAAENPVLLAALYPIYAMTHYLARSGQISGGAADELKAAARKALEAGETSIIEGIKQRNWAAAVLAHFENSFFPDLFEIKAKTGN